MARTGVGFPKNTNRKTKREDALKRLAQAAPKNERWPPEAVLRLIRIAITSLPKLAFIPAKNAGHPEWSAIVNLGGRDCNNFLQNFYKSETKL
jgi:hypothetical protein